MPTPEAGQYIVQDEKEYTIQEKKLCELLAKICGVKVNLGQGPEASWAIIQKKGEATIILDRRLNYTPLYHLVSDEYEQAVILLLEPLSHALAHVKIGDIKNHDINFYKKQTEAMQAMMGNYVKIMLSQSRRITRNPSNEPRMYPIVRKKIVSKTKDVADKVLDFLKELVKDGVLDEYTILNQLEVNAIAKNVDWSRYLKITNTLADMEKVYAGEVKVNRAKNRE